MKHTIMMDVDTGIDDAMAIMFAVKNPDIDVLAISCVSGNVGLDSVVENTLKILDAVEAPDIPVAGGATRPIIEKARSAAYVHGEDGLGNVNLPATKRRPLPVHAVEMMRQVLTDAPEPITLVALAPLTNIALLLRTYPECTAKIDRILFMGGSASVGNATAVAEFNIWHDPEAAHMVLNSGVPLTMYGLDVFNTVGLDAESVQKLAGSDNAVAKVLGGLLAFRVPGPEGEPDRAFSLIGDAGAVCALVANELMHSETCPVQVQLAPGDSRGQTIVDRRVHIGEDTIHGTAGQWPTADVIFSADIPKVLDLFLSTLGVQPVAV
ncbi:pyrimidine-specific ribonucleoside hydrolase [Arthrobacter silviterrae]|uniref:Nucleoside hydrolase n=1 Tax=Arthrobacter silviterrae TaxID=2026658 RepID=A0ABX0DFZ8_9MICC|nr:nucleoside hydrolase [Arthrobacter silviterrae]MDQ0276481.1 pyrimidine-specific ribonucleoside hydrolase [Arthrobacter silviterrae]NGN84681.1 nucleoside hydrolase [Arthrobacter silviterrae]